MVGTIGSNQTAYATTNLSYNAATNSIYIAGDLYIDGQQTYINKTNLATGDATLTFSTSSASAATAANSGIQVGTTSTPYASFLYDGSANWVVGGSAASGLKAANITDTGLSANQVTYAGTGGLLSGSNNLTWNGTTLTVTGTLSVGGTVSLTQPTPINFANGQYIKDNGSGGFVQYSGAAFNINAVGGITMSPTSTSYAQQQGALLSVNGGAYVNGTTTSTNFYSTTGATNPGASTAGFGHVANGAYGGGYLLVDGTYNWGIWDVTGVLEIGNGTSGGALTPRLYITPTGGIAFTSTTGYGTAGQYLMSNGNASPSWNTISVSTVNLTQTSSGATPQYMVFANTSTGSATLEANGPTGLVYIPTGNKFGIGTSAPADTDSYGGNNVLDVYGPVYMRQNGSAGNRMSMGVSGGIAYVDVTTGLGMQTQISGGTVMNLDTSGNLQISANWTAPQQGAKLSVQGGGYFSSIVTATTFVGAFSGGVSQVQTQANAANATNYLTFVSANNASPSAQSVYTTSTHVINPSTGYIGIGTSNLVSPLNVYATQALGGTAGNYTPVLSTQASGGTSNNVYFQEWRTRASAGTDWTTEKITHGVWVDASFTTPATSLTWHERYPNAGTQAWGNGASTFMFLNGSGYLGLGITNPSYQLVVSNAGAAGIEISPTSGINSGGFVQAYNRSTSAYFDLTYYATAHHWTNGNTEVLRLTSAGQLTLGTTSPYTTGGTAALTVYDAGAGSSPSIAVGASSSDEMYVRRLSAGNYQLQSVQSGGNAGSIQLQPYGGGVLIGTATPGSYTLQVVGSFAASTKSFVIEHPTRPGYDLRYGSLEGPENGVYVRGRLKGNRIELPEYWTKLVDPDSITVNLTPVGKHQKLYVEEIKDNVIIIGNDNLFGKTVDCFYTVFGERCDVEKLVVEIQKPQV